MKFQRTVSYLNYDLMRLIMLFVVASDGGATCLARALAICKDFYKFKDDTEILLVANFNKFSLPESVFHFQHMKSILVKCAEAGNSGVRYILAQVLLVTFSQLREQNFLGIGQASTSRDTDQNSVSAFFSYFRKKRPMGSNSNGLEFNHFDLVWYFVKECNFLDFVSVLPHIKNYVKCFGSFDEKGVTNLFEKFSDVMAIFGAVVDVGKQRRMGRLGTNMKDPHAVVHRITEMHTYHLARRSDDLSRERWKELKREAKYMKDELLIIKNNKEIAVSTTGVPDMQERFFYYVGFDEPVTREIDLRSDRDLGYLWSECHHLAIACDTCRCEAHLAFREIFSIVLN